LSSVSTSGSLPSPPRTILARRGMPKTRPSRNSCRLLSNAVDTSTARRPPSSPTPNARVPPPPPCSAAAQPRSRASPTSSSTTSSPPSSAWSASTPSSLSARPCSSRTARSANATATLTRRLATAASKVSGVSFLGAMPQAADRANQIFLVFRSGNLSFFGKHPFFLLCGSKGANIARLLFFFSWDGNEMIIASPPPPRPLIGLNLFSLDKVDRQNQYLTPPFSLHFRRALVVFLVVREDGGLTTLDAWKRNFWTEIFEAKSLLCDGHTLSHFSLSYTSVISPLEPNR
ncbi:hypothetical protein CT0861_12331, partial [Colletotrichum tofieldiae]